VNITKFRFFARAFRLPIIVTLGLFTYLILILWNFSTPAIIVSIITIIIGSYKLLLETYEDIKNRQFGLDYIAILAIVVSLVTHEYLVGIILALMIASGRNLEEYAASSAKRSLTELSERIPHDVLVLYDNKTATKRVRDVKVDEIIVVRKGEVVPLDGVLLSHSATVDESSLTGEALFVEKYKGDILRSGIINVQNVINIKVTKEEKNSTYHQIVLLVEHAQSEKAPLVRLADKYSIYFTLITLALSLLALFLHGTLESILAVLVVATPCPLILATPVALIGGMNAQAKKRIIIKQLASIEALARVTTIVFDKTGTITLGKPTVRKLEITDKNYSKSQLLSAISAIERNSLHPLAKAIVAFAKDAPHVNAKNVKEIIGQGIEGVVNNASYTLKSLPNSSSQMRIGVFAQSKQVATLYFTDEIKSESKETLTNLERLKLKVMILTGDKYEVAKELVEKLKLSIDTKAELTPEGKQNEISALKKQGEVVAMVGDGINDAPALALSDVGMVFANEEKTASSEAADIVLLGGDFSSVLYSLLSSRRTIAIARQSILAGIGMSILCMIAASFGLIPPLIGALLQEGIDVAVILNALRASKA
jgi:heavy metal translocating P-type ATPase